MFSVDVKQQHNKNNNNFDVVCFQSVLLDRKSKKKIHFFSAIIKNISSHVLKISEVSLVLLPREFTDITFSEIYIWYSPKKVNILYIFTHKVGHS